MTRVKFGDYSRVRLDVDDIPFAVEVEHLLLNDIAAKGILRAVFAAHDEFVGQAGARRDLYHGGPLNGLKGVRIFEVVLEPSLHLIDGAVPSAVGDNGNLR